MKRLTDDATRAIKAEMVRRGLRLHRVANRAGISPDRLSKVLCGVRRPYDGELTRVAEAMNHHEFDKLTW